MLLRYTVNTYIQKATYYKTEDKYVKCYQDLHYYFVGVVKSIMPVVVLLCSQVTLPVVVLR